MVANAAGRLEVSSIGLELGVVWAEEHCERLPWLRWFTPTGEMLPSDQELAAAALQRAELAEARAAALAARLRALGVDPDAA